MIRFFTGGPPKMMTDYTDAARIKGLNMNCGWFTVFPVKLQFTAQTQPSPKNTILS
jgi:hypothetical protein